MTTRPVLVRQNVPHSLEPLSLVPRGGTADRYDEKWLQTLIQTIPDLLPTAEIEPGFGRLIPVAIEVPCGHGLIDNLFVSPSGGIAIVETKLWRNLDSRRLVVAQALDYAAALAQMGYAAFERAALAGVTGSSKPASLFGVIAEEADALDEPKFIEAVSSNLRRGRMLVIVAADGVRAETEALADLLQSHAGARFTFALVAIELYTCPDEAILAVPRSIVKTHLIERGVVTITDDRIMISPNIQTEKTGIAPRSSLTEDQFFEAMAKRTPSLPKAIRSFLSRLTELQVEPQWLKSLKLNWESGTEGGVNLGYVSLEGVVSTDFTLYALRDRAPEAAHIYLTELAQLIAGRVITRDERHPFVVDRDGRKPRVETLLPACADGWLVAIERLIARVQETSAK